MDTLEKQILQVQRSIEKMRNAAHILTPMARTQIDFVAEGFFPTIRVAKISADPADKEVYEIRELPGKLALTMLGLQLLEAMAGITDWEVETNYIDSNPLKAVCKAKAYITDIDGMRRNKSLSFAYDLTDGSPQAEKMLRASKSGAMLAQARANIFTLVESKACNRVRRALLGLQATFTAQELQKPFVVVTLVKIPGGAPSAAQQEERAKELYGTPPPKLIEAPKEVPAPTAPDVRAERIQRIKDLYPKKVRSPRDSKKPPLEDLDDATLVELENLLLSRPDIAGGDR